MSGDGSVSGSAPGSATLQRGSPVGNAGLEPGAPREPGSPFDGAALEPDDSAGLEPGVPKPSDRGWHSRGYMPHFSSAYVIQHVTYHLADSVSAEVRARLEDELRLVPARQQDAERRHRIEAWLDAGHGCCLLREPVAARLVQDAFLFFDGERYRLLAWVVMPNHVHVLFQPLQGWTMAKIVASWKSYTGRRLAPMLPPAPSQVPVRRVWQREYWDRFIRNEPHFDAAREYIHNNPVKAGLVARSEDWEWSSARLYAGNARNAGNARLQPGTVSRAAWL